MQIKYAVSYGIAYQGYTLIGVCETLREALHCIMDFARGEDGRDADNYSIEPLYRTSPAYWATGASSEGWFTVDSLHPETSCLALYKVRTTHPRWEEERYEFDARLFGGGQRQRA